MKTRSILLLTLCAFSFMSVSCSGVDDEPHRPEFHVELYNSLHLSYSYSTKKDVQLSICVSEEDADYLSKLYLLSVESLYGQADLIEYDKYGHFPSNYDFTIVKELDSAYSCIDGVFNQFYETGMIDKGYSVYNVFPVTFDGDNVSFRLKLYYYETGEVFYTAVYTLSCIQDIEGGYYFWLAPGLAESNNWEGNK